MGDALKKDLPETEAPQPSERPMVQPAEVQSYVDGAESPAKVLQDKLDRHFAVRTSKFSGRFITWLVIGTCAGTWLTGIGLYSTL